MLFAKVSNGCQCLWKTIGINWCGTPFIKYHGTSAQGCNQMHFLSPFTIGCLVMTHHINKNTIMHSWELTCKLSGKQCIVNANFSKYIVIPFLCFWCLHTHIWWQLILNHLQKLLIIRS